MSGHRLDHVNYLNFGGNQHTSETADRLRCCQLRLTVSVENWCPSSVNDGYHFFKLTVDICVQNGGREELHRAGLKIRYDVPVSWQFVYTQIMKNEKQRPD